MGEDRRPGLLRRFTMFLERARGTSKDPCHSGLEKFRADMYNSTNDGGLG